MSTLPMNHLPAYWQAYLTAYLPAEAYEQVKDLQPGYLRDLYKLNGYTLFDTTFLHVNNLVNMAHDLPHVTRAMYALKEHRMRFAMISAPGTIEQDGRISNQLLNMRTTPDQWRTIAQDLALLYDFYRFLNAYEADQLTARDRAEFAWVLDGPTLLGLFHALGLTRKQQENHTWIWRDK